MLVLKTYYIISQRKLFSKLIAVLIKKKSRKAQIGEEKHRKKTWEEKIEYS